jgi:hypothetical protein
MAYLPLPTSLPRLPYQIDPETARLYHRSSKAKSAEHRAQLETVRFLYGNDTLTPDHVNCLSALFLSSSSDRSNVMANLQILL